MAEEETANVISGEVSGTTVQVGAVHGDMYVGVSREVPRALVDPPAGWEELPELPAKIVSLLRAQIENAEIMPYRLRGARRPSLSTVYVRQDVTTGSELQPSDQARPLPVLDSKGRLIDVPGRPAARITVRPPSRSMREALDGAEHMLVTGGPGQGKSTLSLRLAADVARQWQEFDDSPPLGEPVVPLRLAARELATRLELPFFEALAETVRSEYGAMLDQPLSPDDLTGRVAGCRWLLLVDGLDEVADTAVRDRMVAVLASRASDVSAAYRIVLTTRPIEGATLAPFQRIGAARYELLPFDDEAFALFAEHWFSENAGEAKRFVRQVRDAHLGELVRVPLLATIAAIIFGQYADRPLPDNQYELYETYLGFLRSGHSLPPGPFDECSGRLLEHLGRVRLEEDTSLITAACRWVSARLPELGAGTDWRERLVGHLGAVGPFLLRGDDLGFMHHSFAEHLAATAKARMLPESFTPAHRDFVELLHAAEPKERGRYARRVLLHYTRLYPAEADRLIRYLHEGGPQQHLLAARLLAWHVPAGADAVNAFLAAARAWAATAQHPGGEILAEVSRAAHHPGLVGWLQNLMRDGGVPWPSRVEAAVALATRLANDARAEAVETLRTGVRGAGIDVQARLDAAEALSQCGDAEHDAAVHGLDSVLDSPAATATQHGDAAVVLAGLGPEPRAHAIGKLTAVLEDSGATDQDLVAAAVSLLEIDLECHERCVTVLRTVLDRRSWSTMAIEDAALGLASLGPEHLAQAAAALEHRITDSRLDIGDRLRSAQVLLQLGPQYRARAGELISEVATSPAGGIVDQAYLGSALADCGPEFHEVAVSFIRRALDNPGASAGFLLTAGSRLIDLGSDHWPDAAQALTRAAAHPRGIDGFAVSALGFLATLGAAHKTSVVAELRSLANRPESTVETRLLATSELATLGTEFHAEAIAQLTRLTGASLPLKLRLSIWRLLKRLAPDVDQGASARVIRRQLGEEGGEAWSEGLPLYRWDVLEPDEVAELLEGVIGDRELSGRQRSDVAVVLRLMHYRYHGTATREIVELIRDEVVGDSEIALLGRQASHAGAGMRRVVADALRRIALSPGRRPGRICGAAEALAALDALDDDVLSVLGEIAADFSADAKSRCDAVVLLAKNRVVQAADAVRLILELRSKLDNYVWIRGVRSAVEFGADALDGIRAVMRDRDTNFHQRQPSAVLFAELVRPPAPEAIAELRSQAEDPFIATGWRSSAMAELTTADPRSAAASAAALRATMVDDRQPVDQRSYAAYQLAAIDQSAGEQSRRTLVRLAGAPELTPKERGEALRYLTGFRTDVPMIRLQLALAHDPAASGQVRGGLLRSLNGGERQSVGRALVSDFLVSPAAWSDYLDRWTDGPLAGEAERVLRDRLTGPESMPADRISAAVALSKVSPALEPEAAGALEELSRGRVATRRARRELALLDPARRGRFIADARAVLADAGRSGRDRAEAGFVLIALTSELPGQCRRHLEDVLADRRLADRLRLRILFDLRRLDDVRVLRDDQREPLSLRLNAATRMSAYSREDRVAAVELFRAVAADPACHASLRWSAAKDLAERGIRGHELGTVVLASLMQDEALPAAARRNAAAQLGTLRPDLRGDVLNVLRRLRAEGRPLVRVQVWEAIGGFEADEGARGLLGMARDHSLGPVVRCRSAWAVARLHRDHREAAAIVAREIAHDEQAPRHIRVSAARLLARTSELCRPEARELLERLLSGWAEATAVRARAQPRVPPQLQP
ncbi:hypothetical protein H4696_008577 [Amycolatopsis lexingtonensis]|uniref:NACHT domain-containing protein n=1 Tax=Amycolatopsis lexingtonensis TaxID=218822 RepID=A0ABR9IE63_9PSEU|nr:hypothetical protein [Amycolatopsis lexingtonensis]MBE1501477.1 hypothetical protein [Amycolatopsis lexingtonensis]